ncbi:MAG: TadE-like protein, partial [Gaiellales bacterium]|nr:TadE-like protein [Gaiellales bacterium]
MSRLRSQRGQTAVEFALCATVFFMIVFGLLKVATIYGDYVALQHAARDGVRKGS